MDIRIQPPGSVHSTHQPSALSPTESQPGTPPPGGASATETCLAPSPGVFADSSQKRNDQVFMTSGEAQRQWVIDSTRRDAQAGERVICIRSLEDLEHYGLVKQTHVDSEGKLGPGPGLLFLDKPITIVFDLSQMRCYQVASLNELLERVPFCQGQRISPCVRRVVLVDKDMLKKKEDRPSPDFWRRIRHLAPLSYPPAGDLGAKKPITDLQWLEDNLAIYRPGMKGELLDFAAQPNWRLALFGALAADPKGGVKFREGKLCQLEPGDRLILVDAPWEEPGFRETLARALREGGVAVGGRWAAIGQDLRLVRKDTLPEELEALKRQYLCREEASVTGHYVCLNSAQIDVLASPVSFTPGGIQAIEPLQQLCQGCAYLWITEPLEPSQWLWLLRQLERLSNPPALVENQALPFKPWEPVYMARYTCLDQALLALSDDSLLYRVTPGDDLGSLFEPVRLTSLKSLHYELIETPLLQALRQGTPVAIAGLETAPGLLKQLESLLSSPAYLYFNGKKTVLNKVRVTLLWPGDVALDNKHWREAAIPEKAVPRKCLSLADHLGIQGEMDKKLEQELRLLSAQDGFWKSLDRLAKVEALRDHCSEPRPWHHQEALLALLSSRYSRQPDWQGFLNHRIYSSFPSPIMSSSFDREALQRWLSGKPANRLALSRHFWRLVQHCPTQAFDSLPGQNKAPSAKMLGQLSYFLVEASGDPEVRQSLVIRREDPVQPYYAMDRGLLRHVVCVFLNHRNCLDTTSVYEVAASIGPGLASLLHAPGELRGRLRALQLLLKPWLHPGQSSESITLMLKELLGKNRASPLSSLQADRARVLLLESPVVYLYSQREEHRSLEAHRIAQQVIPREPKVIFVGPDLTPGMLYGKLETWTSGDDQGSQFVAGPLLHWLKQENPPVLLMENTHLAPQWLLSWLSGLTLAKPCLCIAGNVYYLSPAHKVILTGAQPLQLGNGRYGEFSYRISQLAITSDRRRAINAWAFDALFAGILNAGQLAEVRLKTTELFLKYQELIPGVICKRQQVYDVYCRLVHILKYNNEDLVPSLLYYALFQAFSDSMLYRLPAKDQAKVKQLLPSCQQGLPVMAGIHGTFDAFLLRLKAKFPKIDFDHSVSRLLAWQYWGFLERQPLGLKGLIIEGPAGIGKDLVLRAVLSLWREDHPNSAEQHWLNSAPDLWLSQEEVLQGVIQKEQCLVISEPNLLPGFCLESMFKQPLALNTRSRFLFIGTMNPPSFSGRRLLPQGLVSSCALVRLPSLNRQDINGLVLRHSGGNSQLAQWLESHYQGLCRQLSDNDSPVQLSTDDLLRLVRLMKGAPGDQWRAQFDSELCLALGTLEQDTACQSVKVETGRGKTEQADYWQKEESRHYFLDGNITLSPQYSVKECFCSDQFDSKDYRLKVLELVVGADGRLLASTPGERHLDSLQVAKKEGVYQLQHGEILGRQSMLVCTTWQPLPGISAHDTLVMVRSPGGYPIEAARCRQSGQLMIRYPESMKKMKAFGLLSPLASILSSQYQRLGKK